MARERGPEFLRYSAEREKAFAALRKKKIEPHNCYDFSEYVEFEGPLGQAYYCAKCGELLQVG